MLKTLCFQIRITIEIQTNFLISRNKSSHLKKTGLLREMRRKRLRYILPTMMIPQEKKIIIMEDIGTIQEIKRFTWEGILGFSMNILKSATAVEVLSILVMVKYVRILMHVFVLN